MASKIEEIKALNTVLQEIDATIKQIGMSAAKMLEGNEVKATIKDLKDVSAAISELKKSNDALNTNQKEQAKLQKQINELREKSINSNNDELKNLLEKEKLQDKISKATSKEAKELAVLRAELNKVNKENREHANELIKQKDAYEILTKKTNEAQKNFKRLAAELGVNSKEAKQARKEFEKFDDELREVNDQAKDGRRDVGRYRQEVSKLADELKNAGNSAGGLGDISSKLTSPVGIATAVIGGLGTAFASTEKGGNLLKDGLASLTGGFNAVVGSTGGFINSLIEGKSITEAYGENLDGLTDKIEKQANANKEATQLTRQNRKDLRLESEALARLRGEYELLQQQSGDATTTLEAQNEATIKAQSKAVEIAEQELVVLQKQIDAVDLLITARGNMDKQDLLDERQEFVNQQLELEGTLNAELAMLGQERRQIEQDQWEQRLDFLFDASDRQKSITERQLQNEEISTERRLANFENLRNSIIKTYAQIEKEFRDVSGQQINIAKIANMEATEQAKLLKTLNLSEIERNRLREAVVEYLAVVQDLEETTKDLNAIEKETIVIQKEIELQRRKLMDSTFDLEGALTEFKKEQLREQIKDLEAGSIARLNAERELNALLLDEAKKHKSDIEKLIKETTEEEEIYDFAKEKKFWKEKEEQRQKDLERANLYADTILDNIKTEQEDKSKALDEEVKNAESALTRQQQLGVRNTKFEEQQLAEAQLKKQQQLERQQAIDNAIRLKDAYFGFLQARIEKDPDSASIRALGDVAQAEALSKLIGFVANGRFEDGGYTGDYGIKEIAGVVHGREFVIDAPTTAQLGLKGADMGDFKNKLFSGEIFTPKSSKVVSDDRLLQEVQRLNKNIESKPSQVIDVDNLGNYIERLERSNYRETIIHQRKFRKWK